jgi:hypothetical protein
MRRQKASALFSSVMVLLTCLIFIRYFQDLLYLSGRCNLLLLEYLK